MEEKAKKLHKDQTKHVCLRLPLMIHFCISYPSCVWMWLQWYHLKAQYIYDDQLLTVF